ncbi:hypothetical protein ACFWN7_03685 [Agromyces sp. NPDC058484]|uniref:hypothetical protein n=1 Tax=Agromyces sp. NPDC058484 TaxID=3346524 RepID=UPI0036642707
MSDDSRRDDEPRQRVERTPGRVRRARLTPAPGSDPSPEGATSESEAQHPSRTKKRPHPDDERITRERPPHW